MKPMRTSAEMRRNTNLLIARKINESAYTRHLPLDYVSLIERAGLFDKLYELMQEASEILDVEICNKERLTPTGRMHREMACHYKKRCKKVPDSVPQWVKDFYDNMDVDF